MIPYLSVALVIVLVYWVADKNFSGLAAGTVLNAILVPITWNITMFLTHNEMTKMFIGGYAKILIVLLGGIGIAYVALIATCFFLKALLGQKDYGAGVE